MIEIQAPKPIVENGQVKIFLAGSIDMNKAERWQEKVINFFKNESITFLNPRRDDFDSELEQSIHCKPFVEQVEWELDALEKADIIFFYFDPNGKAPITLLELGLFCKSNKKVVVCCRDGFWRKGNVDIVCKRFNVDQINEENITDICKELSFIVNDVIMDMIINKHDDSMKIRGENGV